jgi:D-alanine-D-alanine ligase
VKKAVILINDLSESPSPDELDVLAQAKEVEMALELCRYDVKRIHFGLDLSAVRRSLEGYSPDIVFNLVETVGGKGELIHLAPSLLESMNLPFTGSGSYAVYLSSHKILAKQRFVELNIPTPVWFHTGNYHELKPDKTYILKPVWEDGSVGITDKSVQTGNDIITGSASLETDKKVFLEEYIPGREFNISLLGGTGGRPEILPAAEICFQHYPAGKPLILNYASKWDENSFEYRNSVRSFEFDKSDAHLIRKLEKISLDCWYGYGLKGYARVDFRINPHDEPFVLEVNINPCISPDAGFIAAACKAGLSYKRVVERILIDAFI